MADDDEPNPVRPYYITGGRTRATSADLGVETVVTTAIDCPIERLDFERHAIAVLCADPQSIAEIAGRIDVPLGVARVLVSDMAARGLVDAHGTVSGDDLVVLEQLIEGIREL